MYCCDDNINKSSDIKKCEIYYTYFVHWNRHDHGEVDRRTRLFRCYTGTPPLFSGPLPNLAALSYRWPPQYTQTSTAPTRICARVLFCIFLSVSLLSSNSIWSESTSLRVSESSTTIDIFSSVFWKEDKARFASSSTASLEIYSLVHMPQTRECGSWRAMYVSPQRPIPASRTQPTIWSCTTEQSGRNTYDIDDLRRIARLKSR